MALYKLASFVCAFVVLLAGLTTAGAQRREASKEVRSKLFKQMMADISELRSCIETEEGGARAAEEGTTVEEIDLNRDGVPEYEVGPSSPCACGMVNCLIFLYRQTPGGYELILDGADGFGFEVLRTSTNGYADVRLTARDNAATQSETTYKFDGKQYRESRAMLVRADTGESKPAYRRVQFKRGTSSTTVTGKASIILPDNYLVGARTGQVMTVTLSAARKSVRVRVLTPTTGNLFSSDNKRTWTGALPETGDYLIIVDAEDRAEPYSLTISIK